jgi:hypothetical protein
VAGGKQASFPNYSTHTTGFLAGIDPPTSGIDNAYKVTQSIYPDRITRPSFLPTIPLSPGQVLQQPPVQHRQVSVAQVFPHLAAAAQAPTASLVLWHVTLHLRGADGLAGGLHLGGRSQVGSGEGPSTHSSPHPAPSPRRTIRYHQPPSSPASAPGAGVAPEPPSAAAGACGCRRVRDHRRRSGDTEDSAAAAP